MTTAHIEHAIKDYAAWKAVFDQYDDARTDHKVRHYDISQPVDDPHYVVIRLDFDTRPEAKAFLTFMGGVWGSAQAATVLGSIPKTRITESVEAKDL